MQIFLLMVLVLVFRFRDMNIAEHPGHPDQIARFGMARFSMQVDRSGPNRAPGLLADPQHGPREGLNRAGPARWPTSLVTRWPGDDDDGLVMAPSSWRGGGREIWRCGEDPTTAVEIQRRSGGSGWGGQWRRGWAEQRGRSAKLARARVSCWASHMAHHFLPNPSRRAPRGAHNLLSSRPPPRDPAF